MELQPLGDKVILRPKPVEEEQIGSLYIPPEAREKQDQGEIVAVGPGNVGMNGERITPLVKKDDIVLYAKFTGTMIKFNGEELLILRESDILAIIKS